MKIADLEVKRGDTKDFVVRVTTESGAPYDLTGFAAVLQVKTNADDASPVATAVTVVNTSAGTVSVSFSTSDTEAIYAAGNCVYDLEIRNGDDSIVQTIIGGKITATNDVSR